MDDETFDMIVEKVHELFLSAPEEERDKFLLTIWNEHSLLDYHSTLGRFIRNEYNLWAYEWEKELNAMGIDMSPNHPDAVSMRIIEEVWKLGNEAKI